jgi:hypothetical protein
MRLTWKKQANETGLASICQTPRGYNLRYKGAEIGHIYFGRSPEGWYWYARSDKYNVPLYNSAAEGIPRYKDIEAAKAACKEYVMSTLQGTQ